MTYPIKPIEPDRQGNINNLPDKQPMIKGPEKIQKSERIGKKRQNPKDKNEFERLLAQQIKKAEKEEETSKIDIQKKKGLTAEEAYRLSMKYPIEQHRSKKIEPKIGIQAYEKQIEEATKELED